MKIFKLAAIGAALGVAFTLAGCATPAPQEIGSSVVEAAKPLEAQGTGWYKTGDGRAVWCIYFGNHAGYSCDWENAVPDDGRTGDSDE